MTANLDKSQRWKADILQSVDMYNDWFLNFAPEAFRSARIKTTADVKEALNLTGHLTDIRPETLQRHLQILPTLRMSTCPPLAVDRLNGLAKVPRGLVTHLEKTRSLPTNMSQGDARTHLQRIGSVIARLADPDIFVWLGRTEPPNEIEVYRAATIVADRLCGAVANPIIRNAQEKRQLAAIAAWLESRGYRHLQSAERVRFDSMPAGTFSFRLNVPVDLAGGTTRVNIPVDAVIMPRHAAAGNLPILIEAKSAGDFTNVNKRRKEEATKMVQLRNTYGPHIRFNLFLCGYFDGGYLGYEATEGIDWVWEHRIDDLAEFGL